MNVIAPNCYHRRCKHLLGVYQPDEDDEGSQVPNCTAFAKGIPEEIAYGDNKHLTKYPGQENDIVFEKFEEDE